MLARRVRPAALALRRQQLAHREHSVIEARARLAPSARKRHTNPTLAQPAVLIVARVTTARLALAPGYRHHAPKAHIYLKVAPSRTRAIASNVPSAIGASVAEASQSSAALAALPPSRALTGAPTANPGAFKMSGAPPCARFAVLPRIAPARAQARRHRARAEPGLIGLA